MNLLELKGVRADYEGVDVLFGVDLAVAAGEVVALLGPNGAGKTTLLRVASGLHAPSQGDVILGGRRANGAAPTDLVRSGVCLIPEGRGVFPNLTVRENLQMMTFTGRPIAQVEEIAYSRFPRLGERRKQLAGTLSGGEQQMLALVRGLVADPGVLLLDELSMGLAPIVVSRLYEIVGQIAADGMAIVVVEQFASTVLGIADRAVVLVRGQVVMSGPADAELAGSLAAMYLGDHAST
ncbi:MAG: transporter related [Ilumatobacteraceae bacterium]|nr:transporter related [Ilumatobacteraceae bacterium]